MTPSLRNSLISAHAEFALLANLMLDLSVAERNGNPVRVGNVAHDARVRSDALADALNTAFAQAANESCGTYERVVNLIRAGA